MPVLPEFLIELHYDKQISGEEDAGEIATAVHANQSLERVLAEHPLSLNGRSMALLHQLEPGLATENGQVGTILSSKAFVQLMFNPFVSLLINRFGYELSLILGVLVLFTSTLLYLFGDSFLMLLLPRALQGIGSALINVAGMAMMANMFREEEMRLATIGFCLGGMATGVLVGYPLGGLIYHFLGKSALFYFLLFAISMVLFAQLMTFNWSPINAPACYDKKTFSMITNTNVILAIVIISISTVTMSLLESFLPLWLIQAIHPRKWELGIVFVPDSIGYLIGTNLFNLFYISLRYRWFLITIALWIIGISALMVPLVPNMLYLIMPHFGIGFGIGTIDSALLPLLAELVDEHFAAQYGYVYAAAQTAASAAYAFGPLLGGALLKHHYLSFESLMHLVGGANLMLCVLSFYLKQRHHHHHRKTMSTTTTTTTDEAKVAAAEEDEEDEANEKIALDSMGNVQLYGYNRLE